MQLIQTQGDCEMSGQRTVRVSAAEMAALRDVLERAREAGRDSHVQPRQVAAAVLRRGEIGILLGRSWEIEGGLIEWVEIEVEDGDGATADGNGGAERER